MGRKKKKDEMSRDELLGMLGELADESVKNLYSEVFDKNGTSCGFRYDTSVAGVVLKTVELSAKLSGVASSADEGKLHVVFEDGAGELAK